MNRIDANFSGRCIAPLSAVNLIINGAKKREGKGYSVSVSPLRKSIGRDGREIFTATNIRGSQWALRWDTRFFKGGING